MTKSNDSTAPAANFGFIQLGRTFHELSKYANESDDVDISRAFHIGKRLGWPDLLNEYRLIILSEAGSGKTAEIRNVAQRLRADGKKAFFLRLEHMPTDFEVAFEVGTEAEFRAWLAGGEEGWLLLDSVDEARLRNPRDFELAIRKLGHAVSAVKDRAHIVITGRTTAWRPKTDLAHCLTHLPYTPLITTEQVHKEPEESEEDELDENLQTENHKENKDAPGFKIVTLDDLSSEQIATFVTARGISDSKAFLDAVERADAWSFTARPQDLEDLTSFWLDKGRIGSRLEIMRNSINRRLEERDQDRAEARPLAMERAREGARLLAAATTLSKDPTIRVPDGADNTKGIPVQAVLTDWNDADRSTLLSRPIFDEAIYGAVRFHHRSVREYLVAEWFAELLKRETSRRAIENLFFREQYGTTIVTPKLRPILPWLCILDDKIRARVTKIAPEIAFEGGDPSQWPLNERRRILNDVCQQLDEGIDGRSAQDYAAVQRFANEDIASDVRSLIQHYASDKELCSFLLRMVWLGQLKEALPEVIEIALSAETQGYKRMTAFRALKAIGSAEDKKTVRESFIAEALELDRELLAELIESEEPTAETVTWLTLALKKSEAKEEYTVDRLSDQVKQFVERAPIDILPALVEAFDALLAQPPVIERRFNEVSQKYEWLLPAAARAVERLASSRNPTTLTSACLGIIRKLACAQVYQSSELSSDKSNLTEIIPAWPELNRALFWFEVEATRTKEPQLTDYWCVSFGSMWRFSENDFTYVAEQITQQALPDNKLVALSLAFDIYRQNGRLRAWRAQLKKLTAEDTALSDRLSILLNPPAQPHARRWKAQERRWKKRSEAHRIKQAENLAKSKTYLTENLEKLKDQVRKNPGQLINPLSYLYDRCRGDRVSNRWTDYNWQELSATFGEGISRFYRDAAVSFWRHYTPTMRSQGALHNETSRGTIFGLVGLEIEFHETSGWPNGLTPEEVERACMYASFELNGFPVWFPQLFAAYPDVVSRFLLEEIQYQLSVETPEIDMNYILSDISWSGQWAWEHLAPSIYTLLQTTEPTKLSSLGKLLKIIQGSSLTDTTITDLAANKCTTLQDTAHIAYWFAVWTGVDPDRAIPALQTHLASINEAQQATDFAMIYLTNLFGSRRRSEEAGARLGFHSAAHLKTLFLLMHQYIRPSEDIQRAGKGVYSPELRDNAQEARNSLLETLRKLTGKEAYLALSEIAAATPDRPWLTHLAKEKAESDGDLTAMTPSEVRELHEKYERTPTDHRQLADLALMRLQDLKDDLEKGDSSTAAILKTVQKETDMRKYIGRELREKAFGRYSATQEEELADGKKIDLRFHGAGFDQPVPCELKLADKWTGPKLFERLENQLCGDYLRDPRSNRGLFVLVFRGQEKDGWTLPDGKRVDFAGLVAALQERWKALSPSFPNIDDITVIGIDLTLREVPSARDPKKTMDIANDPHVIAVAE